MKLIHLISFLLLGAWLHAQDAQQYKFRVYLKDKGNIEFSTDEPEKFLSPQSINRKQKHNIEINQSDFPISDVYFNQISQSGTKVVSFSKWFETIVIQLNDSSQIENIKNLSFVDSVKYVWKGREYNRGETPRPRLHHTENIDLSEADHPYGITRAQFEMHNAIGLHTSGYTGKGINIGVIDAGFTNVDVIPYFVSNNIAEYKSFVPAGKVLSDSDHGTKVFSTISATIPGKMMGSAPAANFYLLHSEDVSTEFPVEEDYWVRAVEYADSVGVDIVNSSLGYNSFDDEQLNYSHENLDGRTAIMSRAADLAFKKGMIIVTSAGNEGMKPWRKISVPGDAVNALTVGAVSTDSVIARFSSVGYTADGRLKPDLVSVGSGTVTISREGRIVPAFGTSFSSPFMTGLIASLWSINPELDRNDLLKIVKESGDRFHNPDSVYGNGIPDMGKAMEKVLKTLKPYSDKYDGDLFSVSGIDNDSIRFSLNDDRFASGTYAINLLNESGEVISQQSFSEDGTNVFPIGELAEKNEYIYAVLIAPHKQKTVRFKL